MNVFINHQAYELEFQATVTDALSLHKSKPPFAVAVNLEFIPNTQYSVKMLHDNDRIDIISPVTGG
jgi:sulfur carrier protein